MSTPRFAFPIFLTGSAMLSAGPLLVRLADVDPLASAFWRMGLAVPFLYALARMGDRDARRDAPSGRADGALGKALMADPTGFEPVTC